MNFKILVAVFLLSFSFSSVNSIEVVNASENVVYQDEMVSKVINMIDLLPDNCTLSDEDDIKKCRAAYENLLPSQKVEVTNLLELLEKENQIAILYSEINYVVSLIDTLPNVDEFELTNEKKLNEVINKYNELDNLQKGLVNNYQKLVDLSNKLNNIYSSIDEIINLINTLPNIDLADLSIYSLVDKIEVIYSTLSDVQKEKVTNLNKYLDIKELLKNIEIIKTSISNLPKNLTNEHLIVIENIQQEYLKLTPSQRTLITNYEDFYKLYLSILDAKEFNNLINELIQYINLENRYLLDYLFERYNEFSDNQKVFITNYEKLTMMQEKIEDEEIYYESAKVVIDAINNLPLNLTLEDKELINGVRKQYDSLHDNSKKYVDNYYLLLNAEVLINKLENEKYASSLDDLYNELENVLSDIDKVREDINSDEEESKKLIDDIKKFIEETKENEAKGFNKYIIIAIGLISVFIIVAIVYIFSLNHKKINIDNEEI